MGTFQKTESKSVPWNLSGIPAAVSFGPRRVTNSSKSTWPSPAGRKKEKQSVFITAGFSCPQSSFCGQTESERPLGFVIQENVIHSVSVLPHRPCPVSGWWPPAPPRLACSPGSAWPSPALALRWTHSHRGQTLWRPRGSLQRTHTHTRTHTQRSWSLAVEQDMKVGNVPRTKDTFVMPHQCLSHSYMGVGSSGEQIPPVK